MTPDIDLIPITLAPLAAGGYGGGRCGALPEEVSDQGAGQQVHALSGREDHRQQPLVGIEV